MFRLRTTLCTCNSRNSRKQRQVFHDNTLKSACRCTIIVIRTDVMCSIPSISYPLYQILYRTLHFRGRLRTVITPMQVYVLSVVGFFSQNLNFWVGISKYFKSVCAVLPVPVHIIQTKHNMCVPGVTGSSD